MQERAKGVFPEMIVNAYLVIIFAVYPLYMKNGYVEIGRTKERFFVYSSAAALLVMLLAVLMVRLLHPSAKREDKKEHLRLLERLSATDICVLLYASGCFFSYAVSSYRQEAWHGCEGWYMGCGLQLMLCALYFGISRLKQDTSRGLWNLFLLVSAVVFLLGVCNRFSFYPIPLEIKNPSFLSTLGNINWYCGYLSVIAPIGIGLFIWSDGRERVFYGCYVFCVFLTVFSQGSDGIFIWMIAMLLLWFYLALEKKRYMLHFCLTVVLAGLAAQTIRLLRVLPLGRYNYETENLCGFFTSRPLTLWIAGISAVGAVIIYIWDREPKTKKDIDKDANTDTDRVKRYRRILPGILGAGVLLLTALLWKTHYIIPDASWGNGRGATMYAGLQIFKEQPLLQKLFGVGPDCFAAAAYDIPALEHFLAEQFGASRLTNAHNEGITVLVDLGIYGLLTYGGMLGSYFLRIAGKGIGKRWAILFGAGILGYLAYNVVSFAQILNFPLMMILLALGEGELRKENRRKSAKEKVPRKEN